MPKETPRRSAAIPSFPRVKTAGTGLPAYAKISTSGSVFALQRTGKDWRSRRVILQDCAGLVDRAEPTSPGRLRSLVIARNAACVILRNFGGQLYWQDGSRWKERSHYRRVQCLAAELVFARYWRNE